MMNIRDMIFPPRCICCSETLPYDGRSSPLCKFCSAKWELAKARCCAEAHGQPVRAYNFGNSTESGYVLYLVNYTPSERDTVEDRIILNLKDRGSRRIAEFAASELAAVISSQVPFVTKGGDYHSDTVITWIPRRRSSVKRYGFDHMERVAKALSKELNIPHTGLLNRRIGSAEQKTLTHRERRQNAERSMYINHRAKLDGKTVLLIDDIITSGASIDTATELLKGAGAQQVISVTISATGCRSEKPRPVEDVFNIIKKRS